MKGKKVKHLNDKLKKEFMVNKKPVDWCEQLDSSNFIRSVLAPSKYGEYVSKLDDLEIRFFCRDFNLHTDSDIIKFSIANTEWTINGLFGL